MRDNQFLRAAVTVCATLVNRRTHAGTQIELLVTSYTISSAR